jgi:hypothetical protein
MILEGIASSGTINNRFRDKFDHPAFDLNCIDLKSLSVPFNHGRSGIKNAGKVKQLEYRVFDGTTVLYCAIETFHPTAIKRSRGFSLEYDNWFTGSELCLRGTSLQFRRIKSARLIGISLCEMPADLDAIILKRRT